MTKFQETLLALYLAGSIAATGHFLARQDTELVNSKKDMATWKNGTPEWFNKKDDSNDDTTGA